jgi:hypothetical protein
MPNFHMSYSRTLHMYHVRDSFNHMLINTNVKLPVWVIRIPETQSYKGTQRETHINGARGSVAG